MGMVKVSMTLDEKVVKEAKKRAGKGGLSAWVNDLVGMHLHRLGWIELLDKFDAEDGFDPPTEEEMQEARAWARAVIARNKENEPVQRAALKALGVKPTRLRP